MRDNGFEKFFGKFSLPPADEEEIRDRAIKAGQDPDEAMRLEQEKMSAATSRLHEEAGEKAKRETEKAFEEKSKKEKRTAWGWEKMNP